MNRKFKYMLAAGVLSVGLCACGGEDSEITKNAESVSISTESTGSMQAVNPIKEMTKEELLEKTGISLSAPEGAEEVRYTMISAGDVVVAQVNFTLDGETAFLRAQATGSPEVMDISGLYYEWTEITEAQVGYCDAVTYVKDDVGYIAWLDIAPDIAYNLCMTEGADVKTLVELANMVFTPVQGEADGDVQGN